MGAVVTHLKAWLRLMTLQVTWSYKRMQTIGWLLLARSFVYQYHPQKAPELLRKMVVHFNTHTILAPILIGSALTNVEKDNFEGSEAGQQLVRWMGSFGALGDIVYWQLTNWNLSWIAGSTYLLLGHPGLIVFASCWFVLEVLLRIGLFELGYHRPDSIQRVTQFLASPKLRTRLSRSGFIGMSVVMGFIAGEALQQTQTSTFLHLFTAIGSGISVYLARWIRFYYVPLLLPIIFGFLCLTLGFL